MSPVRGRAPLLLVLLLHLALLLAYSSLTPLGEAPDEPAHLAYARFLAHNNRLPATLTERRNAGYRAVWPPLYHWLLTAPLDWVGDAPPTRLKAVGDTARRLIPTNGQTIASFIHTAEEGWPWRGLSLAWHLSRLVSVALTLLAALVTYLIAWQLTGQPRLATAAAALHAFLPQALFIGGVVSDDNLLVLLSGLTLLVLVVYAKKPSLQPYHFLGLGGLLGLAVVAKYNALPLIALVLLGSGWLLYRRRAALRAWLTALAALGLGGLLTGGWWFGFIWRRFNQVDEQGWLAGSLAALSAGASDASLRRLAGGGSPFSLPPPETWLAWGVTLFQSFWGRFGGGGTIAFPGWVYALLGLLCLAALLPLVWPLRRAGQKQASPLPLRLFLLTPLFFLPLPLLRFALSGSLAETAQGRHLFPALPALALGLTWGLSRLASRFPRRQTIRLGPTSLAGWIPFLPPALAFALSLYGLSLIQAAYPPPIPLYTDPQAVTVAHPLAAELTPAVTLAGYELGSPTGSTLPVTLLWQAEAVPPQDYLIALELTDAAGQPLGSWRGHPVGGRYPSRAWDQGDLLLDRIPLPLLPGRPAAQATLTLTLLEPSGRPVAPALPLAAGLSLPASPPTPPAAGPPQLRADGLPPEAPFSYRSTLSFSLPNPAASPTLLAPDGQRFEPVHLTPGPVGVLAHFLVEAPWPSGAYRLTGPASELQPVAIQNRPRQFQPPPVQHQLQANFGGQITLLGYDLPQRRVEPGHSFPVTLHLQAEQTMGQNLVIFNHLLDSQAVQRGGRDRIPQNFYTTLLWVPGEIVSDVYPVPVEPDAPPGIYWLDVGLYPAAEPGRSLPLVAAGQPLDQTSVRLGPIKVGGPPPGLTVTEPPPHRPVEVTFGDQISLLGVTPPDPSLINPDRFTLLWRAETIPQADYTVFVHFLDEAGQVVAQADQPPAGGAYPTSLWDPGEIIRDERPLPPLPPGRYRVRLGLYRPASGQRLPLPTAPDGALTLPLEIVIQP